MHLLGRGISRTLIVVATGCALFSWTGAEPRPQDAAAADQPRNLTIQFGRSLIAERGPACRVLRTGTAGKALTIFDVRGRLAKRYGAWSSIPLTATANTFLVDGGNTRAPPARFCHGSLQYANWADLRRLAAPLSAGNSRALVHLVTAGNRDPAGASGSVYDGTAATGDGMTDVQIRADIAASLMEFRSRGFLGTASAEMSYPGNRPLDWLDAGTGLPFAGTDAERQDEIGRRMADGTADYEPVISFNREHLKAPGFVPASPWTYLSFDLTGGRCRDAAAPCARDGLTHRRDYTLPSEAIAHAEATPSGGWFVLEPYRLVEGDFTDPARRRSWSCSSPDPSRHFTQVPEVYCYADFVAILDKLRLDGFAPTWPDTVAVALGRDRPY
ncbi:MAG: hypothetical protein QOF68_67 [Gaiellales bacterium]|jgi:hypothetical protein|nr:hypothetical protein [Gaiellales bacterium]